MKCGMRGSDNMNKYYMIGKKKNKYKGRISYKEMYYSHDIFSVLNFCKNSNYIMKGFVNYA